VGISIFEVIRRVCKSGTGRLVRLSCLVFLFATWGGPSAFSQYYPGGGYTLPPYGSNTTTENEDPLIDESFILDPGLFPVDSTADDPNPPPMIYVHPGGYVPPGDLPGAPPARYAFYTPSYTGVVAEIPGQTACGGAFDTSGDDMNVNGAGGDFGWITDGTTRVRVELLHQRGDHKNRTGPLNVNRTIRCDQVNGGFQVQNPGAVPLSETRFDYNFKQTKIGAEADTMVGQLGTVTFIVGAGGGLSFVDTDSVFEIKVDQFNFMSKTTNEIDTDRLFAELSGGLQFPVIGQVIGHAGATLIVNYDSINGMSTYNETVVPTTQVRELSRSEFNSSWEFRGGATVPISRGMFLTGEALARLGEPVHVIEAIPGSGAALKTREVDSFGVQLRIAFIPQSWSR